MLNQLQDKKHRAIKSFVRREGRISPGQQRALEKLWPKYGVELNHHKLNLDQLFQRSAPCILEIGFGMGQSFFEQAQAHPENNYIGIEVHRPGVGSFLMHLEKNNINNVKIFCADAVEILRQVIPDHSLNKIQIYFPDPWPKKRHHKRRLIQPEFIELLIAKLKSQGIIHLATDWQDYAEHMLAVLSNFGELENLAGENKFMPRPADRPLTKFEQRGQRLGHGVWDLIFKKK